MLRPRHMKYQSTNLDEVHNLLPASSWMPMWISPHWFSTCQKILTDEAMANSIFGNMSYTQVILSVLTLFLCGILFAFCSSLSGIDSLCSRSMDMSELEANYQQERLKLKPAADPTGMKTLEPSVTMDSSTYISKYNQERMNFLLSQGSEDENGRARRFPQCILIGERKTGTTALLHFMKHHPQIKAPRKEVHYFDVHTNYRMGVGWYLDQMVPTNKSEVTFEKSPSYFRSSLVPNRMYSLLPTVKLLLSVREPVKRAISDFDFTMEAEWKSGFNKSSHTKFEEFAIMPDGSINGEFPPVQRSVYHANLNTWLKFYSLEQFYIFDGDAMVRENPAFELQKIEEFIGLQPHFSPEMFFFSKRKKLWCLRETGCLFFGGKPHPPVKQNFIDKLHEFYKPHNQDLYKLIGKDFGWWSQCWNYVSVSTWYFALGEFSQSIMLEQSNASSILLQSEIMHQRTPWMNQGKGIYYSLWSSIDQSIATDFVQWGTSLKACIRRPLTHALQQCHDSAQNNNRDCLSKSVLAFAPIWLNVHLGVIKYT